MSGFVTILNGGPVVWGSKKQASTSLLSTEAEFIVSTSATQKLIWLRGLFSSINHLFHTATPLLIDNQGAISLIKSSLSSKHIKLHYYFICEKFTNETIAAKYISTCLIGHSTVWTLLALTCANGWYIYQMDVKSAFLNGDLKGKIYMKIPLGQDKPNV